MTHDEYADAGYDTAPPRPTDSSTRRTRARRSDDRRSGDRPTVDRRSRDERARRDGGVEDDPSRRPTMADVSHTNPFTGESFGDTVAYRRGTTVVADGGEAGATPKRTGDDTDDDEPGGGTMGDVAHTPPENAPDPNAVHMRGGEGAGDAGGDADADAEEAEE